jgi:hypothetical protein
MSAAEGKAEEIVAKADIEYHTLEASGRSRRREC